jgi:hypothetical protein
MAEAGTPDSINSRLCHETPEALVNISVPKPLAGEVNVKCVPTLVQLDPHKGSLMMILGSGTELASAAMQETMVTKINSAARRFMGALSILKDQQRRLRREAEPAEASIYLALRKSSAKRTLARISPHVSPKLRVFAAIQQKNARKLHSFALWRLTARNSLHRPERTLRCIQ